MRLNPVPEALIAQRRENLANALGWARLTRRELSEILKCSDWTLEACLTGVIQGRLLWRSLSRATGLRMEWLRDDT
jgi:hypothetical protein